MGKEQQWSRCGGRGGGGGGSGSGGGGGDMDGYGGVGQSSWEFALQDAIAVDL